MSIRGEAPRLPPRLEDALSGTCLRCQRSFVNSDRVRYSYTGQWWGGSVRYVSDVVVEHADCAP